MKTKIFGLVLCILLSCNPKDANTFSLQGTTNNFEDGTVLYLKDNLSEKIIDSAIVTLNQFEFNTKISNFPLRVLLYNKDFSQWRDLWLENNGMKFNASESDFKGAKVSGSASESLSQELFQIADNFSFEERNELQKEFVTKHEKSIVSAYILSVLSREWGKDFTKKAFEKFPEEIQSSEYGKRISNYLSLNKDIDVGSLFADFEMKDRKGKLRKLSDTLGEITLLEFWASWCKPCREENPNLVETYTNYKSKGFEIFAVSLDKSKENWIAAIEKDHLNWPNFCDFKLWESDAALIYGVNSIPDNFLIDSSGKIVARNIRGEELNKKLEELTKQ